MGSSTIQIEKNKEKYKHLSILPISMIITINILIILACMHSFTHSILPNTNTHKVT